MRSMHKLEFRDVTLRYDDGRHGADGLLALESLSLVVDAGESLAIIAVSYTHLPRVQSVRCPRRARR